MASKVNLYSGADVWEPNNILAQEGDWKYSFLWYEPGETYQSYLYPFEISDNLGLAADILSARFHPETAYVEEMELTSSIQNVWLRDAVRYLTYDVPPEDLDLEASITLINLRSVLLSYTAPPESLDLSATVIDINLRVALITYSNWIPEGMDLTANITGVNLR